MRSLCKRSCRLRSWKSFLQSRCNPNGSNASGFLRQTSRTGNDLHKAKLPRSSTKQRLNIPAVYLQLFCCRCAHRTWRSWSCRSQPEAWSPEKKKSSLRHRLSPRHGGKQHGRKCPMQRQSNQRGLSLGSLVRDEQPGFVPVRLNLRQVAI